MRPWSGGTKHDLYFSKDIVEAWHSIYLFRRPLHIECWTARKYSLSVNGIWGMFTPPCCKIFLEKYWQILCILFVGHVNKVLLAKSQKKLQGSSCPRELSCYLLLTGGKWQFSIFEVFRSYLSEFSIFFHEICIVASSYRLLAASIKILLISALISLETRLKVQIFAIFDDFWHFSRCSFWYKPLWPRTMIL